MNTWMPYYLYCKYTNGHLNAILFNRSAYLCNGYKQKSPPLFFCLSIAKWKHEKYGSHDIIVIEIASLTIVHDRKAHIPFFEPCGIFFSFRMSIHRRPQITSNPLKTLDLSGRFKIVVQVRGSSSRKKYRMTQKREYVPFYHALW